MLPALAAKKLAQSKGLAVAAHYAMNYGFFAIIAIGAFWLIKKLVNTLQKNGYLKAFGTDTAKGRSVEFAQRLYSAMISGPEWFNDWFGDGTNYKQIYAIAHEINKDTEISLNDVSTAYKRLYNRDLAIDLNKELNSTEFAEFSRIVNQGLKGLEMPHWLVTKSSTTVFDANLKAINNVRPGVKLGSSYETLITPSGNYDVFYINNQMRLVPSKSVNQIKHAA